ncbi:chemotaxis protein CheB [Simiduia aestuariiviva]|uniref:protein-glutamate O-methyltransferase n=1 Tax=Simiduia aestuariiviva TaxID=1510459 RepID=A0A839UM64_9GAMM|nr:chemotaxis protein CheB [Simiduia aestuariiviva]MBB3167639.1 two-component system CheB/CheR fusion protein [Simiduia aestuariiviva]
MNNKKLQAHNDLSSKNAKYVVGIGSSAGSLSALKDFCKGLKKDTNAAFILLQHLSPDFKSIMDEILEKHCPIPIKLAQDLQVIEKNTFYILEERKYLSLGDGKIILSNIRPDKLHHPINYFFKSLAEEYQNRACGVILSGTGNDGMDGMIALHNVGAKLYCQSPEDAEFDGMPRAVLDTELNIFSAPADELGRSISEHLRMRGNSDVNIVKNSSDFKNAEKIFALIRNSSNIDFSEYKIGTAERRIQHRMGVLEITDFSDYYDYILREEKEVALLAKDMLIGVTQFFRDREVWDQLLEHTIKPLILEKPDGETIRVWVPGCASGEEAYTLSMLFEYAQEQLNVTREVRIFGSDVGRAGYRDSLTGAYDISVEKDIPKPFLERYFDRIDNKLILDEKVQANVVFTTHNVAFDPPFSNMDLVSCRNLLIYFQPSAQKRIISYFHFSLRSNGFLLLGFAESIGALSDYYHTIDSHYRIYQKNSDTRISLTDAGFNNNTLADQRHTMEQSARIKNYLKTSDYSLAEKSNISRCKDIIVNAYAPPSFVIDTLHNVVYSFGNTEPFSQKLKPGVSSLHIMSQLHQDVASVVNTLLKKLDATRKPVRVENVILLPENLKVTVEASCLENNTTHQIDNYIVSVVTQTTVSAEETAEERDYRRNSLLNQQISRLDAALLDAREILTERQHDIETLAEELQCSNEELMAANEELQSSNEELQSVNEELFTVNSEYQEKIKELESANFDLDNLLKYTEMGVIYLDTNSLIRRFTPKAREYVKVLPLDLNRPFTDLSLTFDCDKLHDLINQASIEKRKISHRIQNTAGPGIGISINPYLDKYDNLEGIILIFQHHET